MPIRRLFGLLVCALSLSSVPSLAQTVAFVDGTGADASSYVERTEARVRVTDPAAEVSSLAVDTVEVTLTAALSGDSETLTLRETYRDSGVFEGRIGLELNSPPSLPGTLETGFVWGPPPVYETLTAAYGTAEDTATLEPARIEILDSQGRPASTFSDSEAVHIRVENHLRYDDVGQRDTVLVQVRSPELGDYELITLTETTLRSGIFEGRIFVSLGYSSPSSGTINGLPGDQIAADFLTSSDTLTATAQMVSYRIEILGADGKSTALVPESSPLRIRVVDRSWWNNATVDTVQVQVQSELGQDQETVTLTETGPSTGILEGTVPMLAALGAAQQGDGVLQTAEDLGPPHRFDTVQASYIYYSEPAMATAATYASETRFTDAGGKDVEDYAAGFPAWLRVEDHNANQPSIVDTIQATLESLTEGDSETLVLTETGQDTGIFSGSMAVELPAGGFPGDGRLQAQEDETIRALHGDALGYTASGDLARLRSSRIQFIDEDGRAVDAVLENGVARIRLESAACNTPSWVDTCTVTFTSLINGDVEPVAAEETGEDTGVFVGSIPVLFSFGAATYNGWLEVANSGHPEYLPDEVTATAGPDFASVPTAGFTLRFVHSDGTDAATFGAGEDVGVRLEDQSYNDPYVQQFETLQIRLHELSEIEDVVLSETGPGTGVYLGSVPSHLRVMLEPGDGMLDVELGDRLLVYRSHPTDLREIQDEAFVSGIWAPPPGEEDPPVSFRDAWGNSTGAYAAGTAAWVRVVDAAANLLPSEYDTVQVTLSAPGSNDVEMLYLRETARDSGIFEGEVDLQLFDTMPFDGSLQCAAGDEIEAVYGNFSDQAVILYATAIFIDESGEPTAEVLENGVARLRVVGSPGSSAITVTVASSRGADQESVTLTETFGDSGVYEGSVPLSMVPPGSGYWDNGVLDTANSGSPAYLGDELTVTYQDAEGTAVTIPSRVSFFDRYGRTTTTVAVGERVGVRVEDHNLDDPMVREQIQVVVREIGYDSDFDYVTLTETGYDTNVYEGTTPSESAPGVPDDNVLQLVPGRTIEAERTNVNTSNPTVAQATITGAAVVFVDAEGRPAELYFEGSVARVRVYDVFASGSGSGSIIVTLQSFLGGDSESLSLSETAPAVFEGSISLSPGGGANPNNGYLETGQYAGPPHEFDTLTASYESASGTVSTTVGLTGSRTWFVDAYGNETGGYAAGTTAWVRVEDHIAASMPGGYDTTQVTLYAPATGDSETVFLRETTRDSGVFEGSVSLEMSSPSPNDGRLQSQPGEEIEAVHEEPSGGGESSDTAMIRYSSAEFVDEAGEPTGAVLESGVARLRVSTSSTGPSITATVTSSRGADQESVTLTETSPDSRVYEGTISLSFVLPGSGNADNGVLDTSNSSSPDFLGDVLTLTYQDAEGTAVTIPSRVSFFDSYGRTTTTFALGERVGVRVEDHNLDDPMVREQIQVTVREVGPGDSESVSLTETGYDTNVYEGTIATEDAPASAGDGMLQVMTGRVIEAERLNEHTPYPTSAQATITGASVVFVDAEGRPAEVYYERTTARVRVYDVFASGSLDVTVTSFLGGDSESLSLTETAPSVFEGSIPLSYGGGTPNNGYLETGQFAGPPNEYDTLTASYPSVDGTVTATVGLVGSRVWFVDAYGNEADSYTAGTAAYIRLEDHVAASMPGSYDVVQVTLHAPLTGDVETVNLRETTRESGIFEGAVALEMSSPSPNDGRLQSQPGEEIEVVHEEYAGNGTSSDTAVIRYSSAEFVDETGEPTDEVLESGVARLRVSTSSTGPSITVTVTSSRGADQESVTLTETSPDSRVYEGTLSLSFVLPGSGNADNGVLDASNSSSPDFLGDVLTVEYQDAESTAVTIPSRVSFFDGYGRTTTTFALGERVGVRVEDHNLDDPMVREQIQVTVREAGPGDSESVVLTETGYDTNVYEGTIATVDAPASAGDGMLQVTTGRTIEAERLNEHTPYPTRAQATISGAAVVFVDAEGRPAQVYYERTVARVRVYDVFASGSLDVTVTSFLGGDSESLSLVETAEFVFEGSIPLSYGGGGTPNNGYLETGQFAGPPNEYDTLTASYQSVDGTVTATVGLIGSRIGFVDAYGNETGSYTAGTAAYIRLEDHIAASMPGYYDVAQVTLHAPLTGDSETVNLRETTRESGILEGSVTLEMSSPSPNDGRLQSQPGEVIEVVHEEYTGHGGSSDTAVIRYSSAEFVDEAGEPTGEVLENGVARLRVSTSSTGPSITATVRSSRGADQESVTLTETSPDSRVYEGTIALSFVLPGSGNADNGVLDTSNSSSPDFLGDVLTVTYQDAEGTAVTIPSRVSFFDGYGRTTTTFAVGEQVGVRVEDHNLDDPMAQEQLQVTVRDAGPGDSESVVLTETGYDTNVYEGTIATVDTPQSAGDGMLQVATGRTIEAERLNEHTPYPTVAQATMSGASVVFVDAEGRPAQVYYERTEARVRVYDVFATIGSINVTISSFLGGDSESLSLTEIGPSLFEGSIPLSYGGGGTPNNGYLETGQYAGPPNEYDTLTASYQSVAGTVTGTVGLIGSRAWFIDAYGNETDSYTAGTTAYIRVEDHVAASMPGSYDLVQVTLHAPLTGDVETVTLRETTRESGILEGSVTLEMSSPSPNDGRLQSQPGEVIEVVHEEYAGNGGSSDTAVIRYSSAEFVDEAGEPTGAVLESGVARLRVSTSSTGPSIVATVHSSRGADQESVTLTETSPDSRVYEGTIALSFVLPGSGHADNGVLDTSNSSSPDFLGDALTLTYQDAEGTAVTIPSRVSFFDGYGRTTTTFAVGGLVGVRVEDHNLDDPMVREQLQVTVREVGAGESESVVLTETGYDTNVYEGTIATEDAPWSAGDGMLQVATGQVIEAERLNEHTPYPTVARATMSGASVVFVDAEGRPAQVYFERTEARVRVSDTFASGSITVTVTSFLGDDSESLSLSETAPSVFEGSIPLSLNFPNPNNGYLETGQYAGPPNEYDTLTASYPSVAGTVTGTVGIIGSRIGFIDAYGNEADSYTAGTAAYIRLEDHVAASMPGHYDLVQVTLHAPLTGDSETVTLRETTRESGILEGSVTLEMSSPSPNDGRLQSQPGEVIEVIHEEYAGNGTSSDTAVIRYSSAEFVDESGEPTGTVLESGVARLRVSTSSTGPSIVVMVHSSRGADQESITLTETSPDSRVYEGTIALSFVLPGSGNADNGVLDTSNSSSPDFLGDVLTVTYQDAEGTAVTIPSRVSFFDGYGRTATTFAVGGQVGVRVEDHNLDDPMVREQFQVTVREAGPGDSESVVLTETGYDTNVYEGTIATVDAPTSAGDGLLQVATGRTIEAERLNVHTPYPTRAQATMAGASVVFVDAEGQPAQLYFERTVARVRVSDAFASGSIIVTLSSFLGGDSESVSLAETAPSVFEGSIPLSPNSVSLNNGTLETGRFLGPPLEYDTLTASYASISGTVSDTVGLIGSTVQFTADSYAAGSTAHFKVEDHNAFGSNEVTLRSLATGDVETRMIDEVVSGTGLLLGSIELETASTPASGDGKLQAMPGEEIEVSYTDGAGEGTSSDRAWVRYAAAIILEDGQAGDGVVVENGVARIRVIDNSGTGGAAATVQSRYGQDSESVSLTQTQAGVYEGTIQLSFVSQGGGLADNGTLETSNSGSPEFLQDELTVIYLDAEGHAVTVPSRIGFLSLAGDQPVTEYAVGSRVRVRVQDRNANDTTTVLLSTPGDSESLTLTETAAGSGIFLGELQSSDIPGAPQDGTLTAGPGTVATVEHLNAHTPNPTTAQLPFNGNFAPLAVNDAAQTEQAAVLIDVLANDLDQDPLVISWFGQGAHGTVALEAGALRYTPEPEFVGIDTFNYVAVDPHGGESRATVTVTVLLSNEPPTAQNDSATTTEDQAVNIAVLANDEDPDDDPLNVTLLTQPEHGTAAIQPDNTILYTPAPNANGSDGFTYQIEDPDGATASAAVSVTVTPVNDPPVANDDATTVAEDSSVTVTVLANDSDVENNTLDVTAVTQGTNGAVVLNANDTVTYTPAANFSGADSFTYTVSDGNGGTDTATVAVTVSPANDAPVAVDDSATTDEDTAVTVAVLANDTDLDNDTLDVYLVTGAIHRSAVVNANETVTFTPAEGFHGTATFDYQMRDGNGGQDVGTVTIAVNPVNDAPVAVDDTATTDEDSSVTVTVLANDTDADDDTLEVTAVTQGANGTVTLDPVTYTPAANFHGTDSFTYTVSDGNGGTDTATVNVTINEANDAPLATDDEATVSEDSSVTVNVIGNDSDADDDNLEVTAVTQGTNGTVTLGPVTYTPNADFHGADSFTYTVSDGTGGGGGTDTATVTVTVTPVNDAPIASDDTASVVEDDSVTVNVLGNDSDVDNDTLTVTAVTQGTNGTVTLDPVTYTPAPNFFGTDSFTYTIGDGNGGVDTATVTVTVAPSNDNLTAVDDSATAAEDGSATVTVLANDSDPENDVLSVQSVTQGTNGAVVINPNKTVTYTPNADFHGADSFTYTASDGNGGTGSATVTITVTPVNDAPVAGDDTASVVEDGSVDITVLGNDADVDDDLLSVTSVTQGAHGTVVINGDDTVTYTPAANYNGADSFTYTLSDGNGGEDTATVAVTVGAANDAPTANDDTASTAEDNAVSISVLVNDTDPENDTLEVSAVTQGTNGAVQYTRSGTVIYTPAANFHGTDTFTYTASDDNGGTDTATITVTVTPVNDAPVAADDTASVNEDGSVIVTVRTNDSDVDNDTLDVTAVTQGAHGGVVLHANDTVTYTPAANYNGADSFSYTLSDGHGGTDTATVSVTVGATNDAPDAINDTATVAEDNPVTISVLGNDTDLDLDTLSVISVTQPANGTVTMNPVKYTPNANFFGINSFTYTVSDGHGGTDTATVTVTVTAVNDAPVAVNDSATTLAETAVIIQVRNNDTDIEGATLTVTAVTQGAHGTVAINEGQSVTYTPATAWIGPDSFTYTISDGAGGTATGTVNVTVQAPPRVTTNIQVLYPFNEGSGTTVNDTSGVGTPLNLTVASAGAVTWLPGALSINSNTLIKTAGTATKVINACKSANQVTVEAWVDPLNLTQTGPAAIVTISQTNAKRDVTLGQSGTGYNGQLRTSSTGQDGTQHNANNVVTTNLTHVVYTRSSTGAVRIYVDGNLVTSATLTGNLTSWDNYNLALGGELSGTRYWRGELHLVAIYSRALSAAEVRQNWLAGAN